MLRLFDVLAEVLVFDVWHNRWWLVKKSYFAEKLLVNWDLCQERPRCRGDVSNTKIQQSKQEIKTLASITNHFIESEFLLHLFLVLLIVIILNLISKTHSRIADQVQFAIGLLLRSNLFFEIFNLIASQHHKHLIKI